MNFISYIDSTKKKKKKKTIKGKTKDVATTWPPSSQSRVSCTIWSLWPWLCRETCLEISKSMALFIAENEFKFFISTCQHNREKHISAARYQDTYIHYMDISKTTWKWKHFILFVKAFEGTAHFQKGDVWKMGKRIPYQTMMTNEMLLSIYKKQIIYEQQRRLIGNFTQNRNK